MKKCRFLRGVMAGCLALMIASTAMAVPAKRGWQTMTQPDGTTVQVEQRGDEFYHYWVNEAEQEVQVNDNGFWVVVGSEPTGSQVAARRAASPRRSPIRKVGTVNLAPRGLVLLVNYSDVSFKSANTQSAMSDMMNGENYTYNSATGSVKKYFLDQSKNQYSPIFDVYGPVTLSNTRAYYGANDASGNDVKPEQMVVDACLAANAAYSDLDFTKYDNDNDGKVDFVYIIYAGEGEADGGPTESIWPHNYYVKSGTAQISQKVDGKYIDNYACSGELKGTTTTRAGIGTICHEFSHVLGLVDVYDVNGSTDGTSTKVPGGYHLMSSGNYNNDSRTPPNYSIYDKYFLGWESPENLGTTGRNITLKAAGTDGYKGYQINSAGSKQSATTSGVNYYVENRQKTGWDAYIPGSGLLIWYINYNSTEWYYNRPNYKSGSERYYLIPANGSSYSASGTAFPYNKNTSWTSLSGREVLSITKSGNEVSFIYIEDPGCHSVIKNATNCAIATSTDCAENGQALTATITPKDAAYDITSVTVKRGSTTLTSGTHYQLTNNNQSLTVLGSAIVNPTTDAITITAVGTQNRWKYTLLGEHCTPEEATGVVAKNGQLQLAITPASGYVITSGSHISVEMGGSELVYGTGYTYADGQLTINSVTGDVDIVVYPAIDPDNARTFVPATSVAMLQAGEKCILVYPSDPSLAGNMTSNYLVAVTDGFVVGASNITVPKTSSTISVMTLGGSEGAWTFSNSSSQLLGAGADALYWGSGTTTWTIAVNNDKSSLIKAGGNYTLYYNSNRFRTYSNAQKYPTLYVELPNDFEKKNPNVTFAKGTDAKTIKINQVYANVASSDYGVVTYSSSNTGVATVDASGNVTPVAAGTTTITASVVEGDYYAQGSASYNLTVQALTVYTMTWKNGDATFASTNVTEGQTLVLPNSSPAACGNGKVFVGWSTESSYSHESVAPTYAKAGDEVNASTTYYAIFAVEGTGSGGTSAPTMSEFTAISGDLDENIAFAATQGDAGTAPGVYEQKIRIYQNGGLLTISTKKAGITITGVTITSSTETTIQTKVYGGSYGSNQTLSSGVTFSLSDLSTTEVTIKNSATTKNRINLSFLAVSYTGGSSGKVYTQYSTGCGSVQSDKTDPAWTLTDALVPLYVGDADYMNVVKNLEDGLTLSYTSSDPTVASVNASTGVVTALKAGSATITVSTASTDDYYTKALSYNVSVVKNVDAAVVFSVPGLAKTMTIGARETEAVAKADDNAGTVVYSSSKPNVASVDAASGEVSALTPGVARITARVMATTKYEEAQASYDVTVEMGAYNHIVTWKANEQTYLVQYYKTEDALTLPAEVPTCDGKTFQGWTVTRYYLDPFNAPSDMFSEAGEKTVTEDVTYYAVFK